MISFELGLSIELRNQFETVASVRCYIWAAFFQAGCCLFKKMVLVEVDSMGYKFAVLRDFFVFHVGLSGGSTKIPPWKSREWQKFLRYKDRIHGNKTVTHWIG